MIGTRENVDCWVAPIASELEAAGLQSFAALWELPLPLIEAPNRERGGHSGVAVLDLPGLGRLYLKRQDGHLTRSLRPPFRRIPTCEREFQALGALAAQGFDAARPVYFGRRGFRAILLTREVKALGPLDRVAGDLDRRGRREVLAALGREIARFHALGLRHGALYPKHLLVTALEPPRFGFIDLEKCAASFWRERAGRRDLDALNRRSPTFTAGERLVFLRAYLDHDPAAVRRWWLRLRERARRKNEARAARG